MLVLLARAGYGAGKVSGAIGEKSGSFGGNHALLVSGGDGSFLMLFILLKLITWILFAVLLVALIRYLWAKGDKK